VTTSGTAELERARREIAAARALVDLEFTTPAVSRAYYAAFHAAEAALLAVGQSRSRHAGVLAAFGRYIVKEGGLDSRHGRALHSLLDGRHLADYSLEPVSADSAKDAVDVAEALVDAVADWLRTRSDA
jgi:uncharacterized protein (UPF0332 family)